MRRALSCFAAVVLVGACSDTEPDSTADPSGSSGETTDAPEATDTVDLAALTGQIVFQRATSSEDEALIHTMNPDGSHVEELFPELAQTARWSPDGTEISLFCCDDGMAGHIVDVATGELRTLPPPDPTLETYCGGPWSPDGTRLTCESFGVDDPSLNGIYTINAADGGDLRRITSAPDMNDRPGDYSPDGSRLVFQRNDMEGPIGIFVTNVDGTGLLQLTPPGMVLDEAGHSGRWSPTGDQILFVAHTAEGEHKAIWIVSADGGEPQQLPISPTCGGPFEPGTFGCYSPSWSPDGEHIVFVRSESDGTGESIYVVNADGSGLVQLTDGEDDQPHWGPSVP